MMNRSVVAALGFALLASSASAQSMGGQNQPPDQWVMNCNYEKGKDCTVSAMIDGGPNNLLGTFLIISYSVAYTTLTVVADGLDQHLHRRRLLVRSGQISQLAAGPAAGLVGHRPDLDADRRHGRPALQ